MKAVVLEISGHEATVMTHDGDIIGIRNRDYDIGQEINIRRTSGALSAKVLRFAPFAVAAAAVVIIAGGAGLYYSPYGTVSLDINPSVEYTINRFDRVLDVQGVNDDGRDILSDISTDMIINRNIEDAVDATIEQIEADGYISNEDENYIVVSANTKREDHTDELLVKLDGRVRVHDNTEPVMFKVTDDELGEAHKQGISAGKKKIVDTLEDAYDGSLDREEWNKKSVREIVKERDRMRSKQESSQSPSEDRPQMPNEESVRNGVMDEPKETFEDKQQAFDLPRQQENDREFPEGEKNTPEGGFENDGPARPGEQSLEQPGEQMYEQRPEQSEQPFDRSAQPFEQRGEAPREQGGDPPPDGGDNGRPPM